MSFDDYKVVLYRQDDGTWVAEIDRGVSLPIDTTEIVHA